jgi:TolB-like protein
VDVGIHVGDILIDGEDILGDGVNLAARLEGIAEPGGICISEDAFRQVRGKIKTEFLDGGEQALNIARPVRVYRVRDPTAAKSSSVPMQSALPLPDKPSIAVLPFVNISGDPEQEYFADGMVEEIITALSRIRWLFVIARNSSFTYKGQAVDVKQVGRELCVRYVLEGSVRKAGGRVRITGQLIDALTGTNLWADRFDGSLEDVFDLQDKVASSVAGVIEPALQAAETARSAGRPTDDLTAYDLTCARTRWSYRRRGKSLKRCIYWSRRSPAIHITDPLSPGPRSAVFGLLWTAGAEIGGRTPGRAPISHGGPWKWPATTLAAWRTLPSRWPISARTSAP